jgi:hypothetical protein
MATDLTPLVEKAMQDIKLALEQGILVPTIQASMKPGEFKGDAVEFVKAIVFGVLNNLPPPPES